MGPSGVDAKLGSDTSCANNLALQVDEDCTVSAIFAPQATPALTQNTQETSDIWVPNDTRPGVPGLEHAAGIEHPGGGIGGSGGFDLDHVKCESAVSFPIRAVDHLHRRGEHRERNRQSDWLGDLHIWLDNPLLECSHEQHGHGRSARRHHLHIDVYNFSCGAARRAGHDHRNR